MAPGKVNMASPSNRTRAPASLGISRDTSRDRVGEAPAPVEKTSASVTEAFAASGAVVVGPRAPSTASPSFRIISTESGAGRGADVRFRMDTATVSK